MRRLAHLRVMAVGAVLLGWPLPGVAQATIDSVGVEIRSLSEREFSVVARFQVSGKMPAEPLVHVGLHTTEMEVDSASALANGEPLEVSVTRQDQAIRWVLGPLGSFPANYEVSYRVISPTGRIPIPVPVYAATRPKAVHFTLAAPADLRPLELFPHFMPSAQGWSAVLSNVPSFVIVQMRRGGEEKLTDRLLSTEALTNLLILGLLILFTGYWLVLRRKRARDS